MLVCFQGSDKDKRKDAAEKEEKAKKVLFLSLLSLLEHVLNLYLFL